MTEFVGIKNIDEAIKIIEQNGHYLVQAGCNSGELWTVIGEEEGCIVEPPTYKEDALDEYFRWLKIINK